MRARLGQFLVFILLLSSLLFLQKDSVFSASDFQIVSSYNIYLKNIDDDFVTIEDTLDIKSNNSQYYIPQNTQQKFLIKADKMIEGSLEVFGSNNRALAYNIELVDENFEVTVKNASNITQSSPFFAKVTYQTTELINQNGNISNLYLPGLHENVVFERIDPGHNLLTTYQYNLTYHVPIDSPQASFTSPQTIYTETDSNYLKYIFSQEDRKGKTGWVQLGNEQFYFFKISQKIPKTDFLTPRKLNKFTNWISTNILEITLPQEFPETNQQVFFTKISPNISRIKIDEEGNVVAIFEIKANEEQEIIIEGYMTISHTQKAIPEITISEYRQKVKNLDRFEIYTQSDKYWESNDPSIIRIADEILVLNENSNILELIRGSYNYVIEKLEYSQEKAVGDNIRIGALKALQGEPAVCMEYADLLIAILRAQGIPTRAAFGYGNDPNQENGLENLAENLGHQWVQVWIPDYGWLSVDPTWGETNREYIGGDLDHILWYTQGDSSQALSDSAIYSADFVDADILGSYSIVITAKNKKDVPDLNEMQTLPNIILEYETEEEESKLEYILKTTMLGRSIIFIIPTLVVLAIILSVTIGISRWIRSKRTLKYS